MSSDKRIFMLLKIGIFLATMQIFIVFIYNGKENIKSKRYHYILGCEVYDFRK
jgi:hypothetical protein